jgi:NADPH:quinone reductase-like Zn-dependent oxidoreductase
MSRPGTFAEKIALPFKNVFPKPEHLCFNDAAGLTLTFLTAWHMLFGRACIRPGETLLIHGIGGGVATSCLQLAKLTGAVTIVTSSSDEKLEKAKKLGANFGINYKSDHDIPKTIKELTGDKGVDVVADSVGGATMPINLRVVKKGGRIVLCGITGGASSQVDLQAVYWNQLNILGSTLGTFHEMIQMLNAVSAAKIKPVVDVIEPLENVSKAQTRMEQAEQFGKIVLNIYV